jgi:uncharacterized protein
MPRNPVFIDTSALIAFASSDDALHAKAVEDMRSLLADGESFVTSDMVFVEFLNFASARAIRSTAASLVRDLLLSPALNVVEVSHADFLAALDLYESRSDKQWSLVDCSSILICKDRGIRRVLTHDRHFRQAGFEILL